MEGLGVLQQVLKQIGEAMVAGRMALEPVLMGYLGFFGMCALVWLLYLTPMLLYVLWPSITRANHRPRQVPASPAGAVSAADPRPSSAAVPGSGSQPGPHLERRP